MNEKYKSFYNEDFNQKSMGFFSIFFDEARDWAQTKFWLLRIILWGYFIFVFINHLMDPQYQSLFKPLNLGIHELGHFLTRPLGMFISISGGSFLQCLVPVISFFMFLRQKDFFALSVAFCWLSTNLFDVATYIADARKTELVLVTPFGGSEVIHDWNYLLEKLGMLELDGTFAFITRIEASISMVLGLGFGAWLLWHMIKK
jgi:hypothetical protein